MDKRQKRRESKRETIKASALQLFASFGVDKVSMDEIAEKAHVSKVTIYKYFGSKEELYAEVIQNYVEKTLLETEAVFKSEINFLEKLQYGLLQSSSTKPLVSWDYLMKIWEKDEQVGITIKQTVQNQVKSLMIQLFEEGKQQGYIAEDLSFELLYLYSEIFRAGIRAKQEEIAALSSEKTNIESLLNLYYFGFIKGQ